MKTLNKKINSFILLCLAFALIVLSACNTVDIVSTPIITSIRNYAPAPDDTLVTQITPGQWIVIHGQNLKKAKQIFFDGVPAQFNYELFANDMAVVQIPSSIPFNDVPTADLNTIKYVTTDGTTTFNFNLKSLPATLIGNSLLSRNIVGDSVHIYGTNLYLIKNLIIAGDTISPFTTASDGSSIGFKLPAITLPMPWHVVVEAASGTYNYDISIVPLISSISNLMPSQGDSVYVYGVNLNGVKSLSFAGTSITGFKEAADGSSVGFVAPSLSGSAPLIIVTTYGSATTVYDVYNIYNIKNVGVATTGVLANMEWGNAFGWGWWGGVKLTSNMPDFNGVLGSNSNSQFMYFKTGIMKSGDGTSYDGTYNFPIGAAQWMPTANLSDPVDNWAIQFEMSVANPWNGGTLCFTSGFAGNYMARYEPWQISASTTAAFSTKGWQTVTIPLSTFRAKDATLGDGKGASVASLKDLLGGTGNTGLSIYLHNFSTSPTATGLYAAFDNIRVVKIK